MIIAPPEDKDPLIEQLYKIIEDDTAKEAPRSYVGASSIGDKCERKLYYRYKNLDKAEARKAELILAANDGHRSELLAAEYLEKIPGIKLQTSNMGKGFGQLGFSDLGGEFKGHIDGIITGIPQAPKTTHIWENKCCNDKKFTKLINIIDKFDKKAVLEQWDYNYYCQAVVYMDYFDLTRHYTTVWLAGSRKLLTIRTNANPALAKQLKEKAQRVINYPFPPAKLSENSAWFECKMCEFNEFCHNG